MSEVTSTPTSYGMKPPAPEYETLPPAPSTSGLKEEAGSTEEPVKQQIRLTEVEIDNEITALNMMVQFLGLAQKRGVFTIDESAKIWECVKKFQRPDVAQK